MNGSNFIWEYELKVDSQNITKLKNGDILNDLPISLNSLTFNENFYIPIKDGGETYVFIFMVKDLRVWNFCKYYVSLFFKPILLKISFVLKIEEELRNDRDEYIKKN